MTGEQIKTLLRKEGITPSTAEHGGQQRIRLVFENKARLSNAVRQLPGRKWSKTMSAWHIPKDKMLLEQLVNYLESEKVRKPESEMENQAHTLSLSHSPTFTPSLTSLPEINTDLIPYLQKLTDKLHLKAYSYSTIKNYKSHFHSFLQILARSLKQTSALTNGTDAPAPLAMTLDNLTKDQLEKYLRWRQKQKKYSESDQNIHINAVKFYYEQVLGRERMLFDLPRPMKPHLLPAVWAEADVVKLLRAIPNLKHRLMLLMAYAHGMRVSEVASLKLSDMDSKRMIIHIKGAKGKKDRIVNLSEGALQAIRDYYKKYHPKIYLFENENTGEPISIRTIQEVFQAAKKKAGLIKKAGMHSLRHSFATHLHESGIDIKYIKDLLGHNDLRTTERYTHVSKKDMGKIKSPFDNLNL